MKKELLALCATILLGCASASAQKVEAFGGYRYLNQNSAVGLNGWAAGLEIGLPKLSHVAIAADFGGTYDTQKIGTSRQTLHEFTYMAGPRVNQKVGRFRLFEHALFGVAQLRARAEGQSASDSDFAFAAGGGADMNISKHLAIRPAQVDYLLTRFAKQNQQNFRYSTGVVVKF